MAERLVFDLLARDQASAGFAAAGRAASAAADNVKGLTFRLDEISHKSAKARVGLDGDKDALAQLDKLDVKLLLVGKRRANPNIKLEGALRANLEIAAIAAEIDKLNKKASDLSGSSGGLGRLTGALQGLIGVGGSVAGAVGGGIGGIASTPVGFAAIVAAVEALTTEATGLVSGFAAAAAGVGAFGLLALPTFHKVQAAYTGINAAQQAYNLAVAKNNENPTKANAAAVTKALQNLQVAQENMGPSTRTAVTGIQGLVAEFDKMAKAFQPDVMKVFNDGLRIAHTLLPDLKPFADTAATAIDGLLKKLGGFFQLTQTHTRSFDNKFFTWTTPTGFGTFVAQFQKISGPAITAIGDGIGKVAIAIGKLLTSMSAHDVVHTINIAFDTIAGAIRAVGWAVRELMVGWDYASKHVMRNVEDMTTSFSHWAVNLDNAFHLVRDGAKLVFLDIEVAGLIAVEKITGAFSHVPIIGHFFASAHAQVSHELAGIAADAARTAEKINGDWNALHGKTVPLTFSVKPPPGMSGTTFHHFTGAADGMMVTGGIPGRDSVPILAQRDELVVPVPIVKSGAVDHLRGMIPGFAAGGVVGNFTGRFPSGRSIDMMTGAVQAAANALGSGIARTLDKHFYWQAPSPGGGGGMAGPGGGAPAANAALARHMYPAYGSGSEWQAWNYVAMRESGWNQFALNPGSGAYGIAQALPASKYPFAGQAAGGSNPMAQISWMFNYMLSRYGGPVGAMIHEQQYNWYDQGGIINEPILGVGVRSGRGYGFGGHGPETVTPGTGGGGNTYIINISAMVADRNAGNLVVDAIKKHEQANGKGWRS